MTVDEKLELAAELKKEIKEIEDFEDALGFNYTVSKHNSFSFPFLRVTVIKQFLVVWSRKQTTELAIPDKLGIEILSKCKSWKEELQRRIDKLVVND